MRQWLNQLPGMFDTHGEILYDSRNQVRDIEVAGRHVVAKRFKRPPLHLRIDYTLRRPSKACRAYNYGLRLIELGISTPQPIACIETYENKLYADGYLVTMPCYDPDLRLLRNEPDTHPDLVEALMTFIADMHRKGFMHGDTNLSNFLYRPDSSSPTGYHITAIDINRSVFVDNPTPKQCLRNLVRLTHLRQLLATLVGRYALLRGWNETESVDYVIHSLDQFEKRKQLLSKCRKLCNLRNNHPAHIEVPE